MGKGIFVTGTGTDVGKTYVAGLMVRTLRRAGFHAGYYKAAISGAEVAPDGALLAGDALYVNELADLGEPVENLVSYVYRDAVSPHLAARISGRQIDFEHVEREFQRALEKYDYLTMEGSGGIICPLRWDGEQHVVLDDLVKRLGLGAIVVADAGLGTINATVLTIEHLQRRQIPVAGIILNRYHRGDMMEEDNRQMVTAMTGVPVVACVAEGGEGLDIEPQALAGLYRERR